MKKRKYQKKRSSSWPPKGAYPLPDGNHSLDSETIIDGTRIKITGILKAEPDMEALARAVADTAERLAGDESDRVPRGD